MIRTFRKIRRGTGLFVLGLLRGWISIGKNVTIVNDSKYNRAVINHPTQLIAGVGAELNIGSHAGISRAYSFMRSNKSTSTTTSKSAQTATSIKTTWQITRILHTDM